MQDSGTLVKNFAKLNIITKLDELALFVTDPSRPNSPTRFWPSSAQKLENMAPTYFCYVNCVEIYKAEVFFGSRTARGISGNFLKYSQILNSNSG